MNINIKTTNTTLTPAIQNYVEEKLGALNGFLKEEDKIRVEVEVDAKHKSGLVYRSEIDIKPRGLYAEARGNDFYESWDLVIPKIKDQLVKTKKKAIVKRRKAARAVKGV